MRPALALLVSIIGTATFAQTEGRIVYLSRSLQKATDARLRAQAALLLGATQDPAAVRPLCDALNADQSEFVKSAAARSLATLHDPAAVPCLEAAARRESGDLKATIERSRAALLASREVKHSLYFLLEPIIDRGGFGADLLRLTDEKLRAKLVSMGGVIGSATESRSQISAAIRAENLKAFYVRVQLASTGAGGLKMSVISFSFPDKSLLGEVEVKASGAKPADLIKALAPRALDEAAQTFNWSS